MKDRRAITPVVTMIIGMVVALIAIAVILPTGLLATATIKTTVDAMDLGASGNATRTTLYNNIFSGYNLAAVTPIVQAAAVVISVIVLGFGAMAVYRQRGAP